MATALVEHEGGRVEGEGVERRLIVPLQRPEPPAKLEQLTDFSADERAKWGDEFEARRMQVEAKAKR